MADPPDQQSVDPSILATANSLVQALFSMDSSSPVTPSLHSSDEKIGNPEMDLNSISLSQLLLTTTATEAGTVDKLSSTPHLQPSVPHTAPLSLDAANSNLASSFLTSVSSSSSSSSSLLLNPPTVQTLQDSSGGAECQPVVTTPQIPLTEANAALGEILTSLGQYPELQEGLRAIMLSSNQLMQSSNQLMQKISTSTNVLLASSNTTPLAAKSTIPLNTSEVPSRRPVVAQIIQRTTSSPSPAAVSHAAVTSTKLQTPDTQTSSLVPNPPPISSGRPPVYLPLVFPRDTPSAADPAPNNPPSPLPISIPVLPPLSLPPSPSASTPTVMQPVEQEPMDVDVGQAIVPVALDRPPHLLDHDYCLYNPTLPGSAQQVSLSLLSIPSERLSYAPEVPDSPRTLHKLLKILPRRSSSTPRVRPLQTKILSTPTTPRIKMTRPVPSSSSRKRKLPGKRSYGDSGDDFETPDHSDTEGHQQSRRRSKRNAGQPKRYVDDVNISMSDEELLGDIMEPLPAKKGRYRPPVEEEGSDYDEGGSQGNRLAAKYKNSITINPTEGFRYSDMYMDAPAEEANIVERILSSRTRSTENEQEIVKYGDTVEEFLVKYRNYSYLHAKWATVEKLLEGDKRADGKVKRFKAKQEAMGMFANIDDELFNPDYTVVDRVLDVATQMEPNGEVVTHYLVKWKSLPYEDSTWELQEDVDQEKVRIFNQINTLPSEIMFVRRPPPASFKPIKESQPYKGNNILRPYQLEGLNWLLFNWYTRQNCILADEMGLGKTVQSIVLLMAVMDAGIRGPFLVIAPLSTIANWQREFEAWSDVNVVVYHGSAYSRKLIHEYDLYYRDSSGKIISDAYKFNAIVTTYEVMLSDNSELQNIMWRLVVIDEAHRLKNKNCKMLEGLRELHMEHRVLLTGTPLQNNVEELFSLLNFLEPSKFPSQSAFLLQFGNLKTEQQVEELKEILKPMMLRRLKEDVEKSLAPKEETIVEVELTAIQKQYYRAILERNFSFLTKGNTVPNLLNTMMELRKCCNHPFLIAGAELKIVDDFKAHYPKRPLTDALIQASGKLVLIDKLLPKLKEKGHRVLIFSQMVRCLDILEDYLRMNGHLYERIDGQVRGTLRQAAIDRFSKPDSDRFVFLLCTRAGGLGINLTAADTVIIYDSDWNPQNDIQAQARCHRIGQSKMVKVYRLITTNSYEREMFDRASLKLGLDKAVLQSMNTQQNASGPPQLTKKEIEDLLKKGAYGSLMEDDAAANQFCEEDIDQILERRTQVIQLESEGKGSTFSKASFVADGSTDISIDDPDFWEKWAKKARLDLDQLANKDNLVLDTPRVRKQVRRYGNDATEIVDMDDGQDDYIDLVPSRGKRGWTKLECLKTEKGLLTYGWAQWRDIVQRGNFLKRRLSTRDVESIARTILVYCLKHFSSDDKVKQYINRLINPGDVTEDPQFATEKLDPATISMEDYTALLEKDPETLFQDGSYLKHLRRHSTRILLRVKLLHIIRWQILKTYVNRIMKGVHAKDLEIVLPVPEESPPAPWWNSFCDVCLLVAIVKHGYEQFSHWRSDTTLCFNGIVGKQPRRRRKTRKSAAKTSSKDETASKEELGEDDIEEEFALDEEDEESDGEISSYSTPPPLSKLILPGQLEWPSLADINTRSRRLVNAFIKHQKREEYRQVQIMKEKERREREAEASRRRELKKAELAQKWSKREEQDFVRVISFFGVEFENNSNRYDWTKFRALASLGKKSDERLTLYLYDFKEMCRRLIAKRRQKIGYSGMIVEQVNEERAIKCLQRIELLACVRREILPHKDFDKLVKLCESSFEVPHWWKAGLHDKDLLIGVAKHGLYRTEYLLYNDPDLSFLKSIPQSALFTPNSIGTDNESSSSSSEDDEEEQDGPKLRSSASSNAAQVPLGWPKEKAIVIRLSRIIFAFRNHVWPKPMEGLDLFNPVPGACKDVSDSSSDEMSSVEGSPESGSDSDPDWGDKKGKNSSRHKGGDLWQSDKKETNNSSLLVKKVSDVTSGSFQVEKQQGLKMTLKKGPKPTRGDLNTSPLRLPVKIPLVALTFPSKKGLKKIPKKRPATPKGDSVVDVESKKSTTKAQTSVTSSPSTSRVVVIDPTTLTVSDLTGLERVGVINRNTQEKLPWNHSPALKKLESWLKAHPHYNVEARWGPLVIAWGALKHDMYQRILQSDTSSSDQAQLSSVHNQKE